MTPCITRISWREFRESGLSWFVNQTLHAFGMLLVYEEQDDGSFICYPARTVFRGFDSSVQESGYKKLHKYLLENIAKINEETNE